MSVPKVELANKNLMPQLGLGLWQVKDEEEFRNAFKAALKYGYNHFDTAQAYGNEYMLGNCLASSHVNRSDLFITTKIDIRHFATKKLHETFEQSLASLQTDYVDLLLLHFPVPVLRKKAWLALEDIKTSGLAKNIGVSNYTEKHLEEMKSYANEMPVVNQVELHLFLQQKDLRDYCRKHHIQVEAYSPLARANIMDNEVVKQIADNYGKSYAQVMLRWLIQNDLVVIPKSVNPKRIYENIDIFDFELDKSDMNKLSKLDQNKRFCWSPVHVP